MFECLHLFQIIKYIKVNDDLLIREEKSKNIDPNKNQIHMSF